MTRGMTMAECNNLPAVVVDYMGSIPTKGACSMVVTTELSNLEMGMTRDSSMGRQMGMIRSSSMDQDVCMETLVHGLAEGALQWESFRIRRICSAKCGG